jgi:hypothetical protein
VALPLSSCDQITTTSIVKNLNEKFLAVILSEIKDTTITVKFKNIQQKINYKKGLN